MTHFSNLPLVHVWSGQSRRETLELKSRLGEVVWISRRIAAYFPSEKRLGIIFSTCPELPLIWLATLLAGKEPCLLQYPTAKASVEYWNDSIKTSIQVCSLEGLIYGSALEPFQPRKLAKGLRLDSPFESEDPAAFQITGGSIIQLSSGTTGHRKGIRFLLEELARHVADYNQVMRITAQDTIVSWLPLYHDMGFVACFVLPLLLGTPLVLIDPIAWINRPSLLWEAIREYRGTICYLPNFGFEIMAKQAPPPPDSMRLWISCSEPSYLPTLEKFRAKTGAHPSTLVTCYAMAENVFAVSQSDGLKSLVVDGETVVSCGRPIPGVALKFVDGEIFVKSATSVRSYLGTDDVRDPDGFYATGDLGGLCDGELYVLGRRRDVMISAGKKYFLNDFDYQLGKLYPLCAGRIASLADFSETLGTQTALFLIETGRYWDRQLRVSETPKVAAATDLEIFEAHFVPPFFITKTSSGKINRKKTLQDWKAHQDFVHGGSRMAGQALIDREEFQRRVAESFVGLPREQPVGDHLDSLGGVVLRLLCEQAGIAFDPKISIKDLAKQKGTGTAEGQDGVLNIVALVDGSKLGARSKSGGYLAPSFIANLEREFGRRVRIEHFTVPPAPILFSDLVFHDYFMPRDRGPKYAAFSSVIGAIKNASLILVDDEDSLRMLAFCVYPRLAYRFDNNPKADLVGYRIQAYTRSHHLLARSLVAGGDIPPAVITPTFLQLERYLDIPIMKLAFHAEFFQYTHSWDYREYRGAQSEEDYEKNPMNAVRVQEAIVDYIRKNLAKIRFQHAEPAASLIMKDPAHFCSFQMNSDAIDFVIARFDSFCIAGLPSSVPAIEQRLRASGKPFFYAGNLNPTRDDYDCMLCTGFHGPVTTTKPYFEFMQTDADGGRPHNVTQEFAAACPSLVECDPKVLEFYLTKPDPKLPIGNFLLNSMKRLLQN